MHLNLDFSVNHFISLSPLFSSFAKKLLQSLFGGTTVSQIVSKDPAKPGLLSERHELFYTISIEVKCKKSILDGLAAYVEGEVLDGDNKYKCESGEYVEAVKRTCVDRLPPVLILHLKRFEFDFEAMKKVRPSMPSRTKIDYEN